MLVPATVLTRCALARQDCHWRRNLTGASALIEGATAGAIATVAMSAVMIAGNRTGLMGEQPPTTITRFALREAGVYRPSAAASLIAPLTHLGFGALGGAVFGLLRRLVPGVPGGLLGVCFGLAVWAVSYKGWIPALGILPPPEDDRLGRPVVMVAAHVVYGLVLGRLVNGDRSRPNIAPGHMPE